MKRAEQLVTNFSHDEDDFRAAHAEFQYGEWIDATEWGDPAEYSYWSSGAGEAIGKAGYSADLSPTEVGYELAHNMKGSEGHWAYLSDDMYSYIAVGVNVEYYPETGNCFYHYCIMVNDKNYG